MSDKRLLLTTTASREDAQSIAQTLVSHRIAACVNIVGPIESIYRWKGEVENAQEYILIIKTSAERVPTLREELRRVHPYELPELVEFGIEGGLPEYLDWIGESVR